MADVGLREELLRDRLVSSLPEIVAAEVAPAHVHADHDVGRACGDGLVDAFDVKSDQPVRVGAGGRHALANRRIAQERDRDLVELDVAAAGLRQVRDLLGKDRGKIGEERVHVRIDATVGEVRAAVEMHGRGRRQGDLGRHARHVFQELELVERERTRALDLRLGVGRGELDLPSLVVAEPELRAADLEAVGALDEAAPVGAAPELAVGHDAEAGLLLQPHDVADALVLDTGEFRVADLGRGVAAERLAQRRRPQQAADVVGPEGRAAVAHERFLDGPC